MAQKTSLPQTKGWSESLMEWIKTGALVAVPVVVALVGNWYTNAVRERELQARYVELAVGILRDEPTDENKNIRNWAIATINKYSQIPLEDETARYLLNRRLKYFPGGVLLSPKTLEPSEERPPK